ncbi:hypothetical protein LTR37_002833 [Vermiconidia calcicola]|uniref:Uncharacterized protein n=1 Tax=Vermiconidia calcicola TaxID=1690605 RepID=A0ACC3NRX1_9PEZI|nr:hypothetical protein LTR37_002833 [Vermiconidia calcicola]
MSTLSIPPAFLEEVSAFDSHIDRGCKQARQKAIDDGMAPGDALDKVLEGLREVVNVSKSDTAMVDPMKALQDIVETRYGAETIQGVVIMGIVTVLENGWRAMEYLIEEYQKPGADVAPGSTWGTMGIKK